MRRYAMDLGATSLSVYIFSVTREPFFLGLSPLHPIVKLGRLANVTGMQ
jgi:hypothetical protein